MRTRIRYTLAAFSMALILALTACGGDDDNGGDGTDDDIASADDGTSDDPTDAPSEGESTEPLSEDEFHQQLLDWAQCLRDQGLDVEDPAPGEGIQLQNEGGPGDSDAAMKACEDFAPAPGSAPGGEPDEGEEQEEMLAFAQCMRDNGVEAFEDPKPGEGIHADAETVEDPDFEEAEKTCNEQIMGGQPDSHQQGA